MSIKVAVVQAPPVFLDRSATIAHTCERMSEAAANGASLVVFPEAYIPGYPAWVWRLKPAGDRALSGEIHSRLREQAVDLARGDLDPIRKAAITYGLTVVCGMHELDSEFSGATLFNTVVVIDPKGTLLNRHRKLMPTNPERMVWGLGDARGLRVVNTPVGRIGTLICWENYMPLARYALYAQKLEMLVAPTWDCGDEWFASMRHIAREGGCWVIGTGTAIETRDVPANFPGREQLFPQDEWLCEGGAVVVRPFGKIEAGPLNRDKGTLYAEIEPAAAPRSRRSLDVTGHYARPDIFHLTVNQAPMVPVTFTDDGAP